MHLNWYGHGCVGIKSKDIEIIIDPFLKENADFKTPKLKDKIALLSSFGAAKKIKSSEDQKIIDSPGEYEFSEIFIYGTAVNNEYPKIIYSLNLEDIKIAHLASISQIPEEDVLNSLSDVDVLFIPVGDNGVLSANKAAKIVSQLEPKITIPIYYQSDSKAKEYDTLDKFVKEIGLSPQEEDKIILKKKDLGEDMQLLILKP